MPLTKDLMKRTDRGIHTVVDSAHCLRTSAAHPPGPGDLPVLRETNLSNTMNGVMLILDSETLSLLSM